MITSNLEKIKLILLYGHSRKNQSANRQFKRGFGF